MNSRIKEFIEENIDLIENNRWEKIYQKASDKLKLDTGKFTEFMLQADIHPEDYLKELPEYFLYESNIKGFIIPNTIISIGNDAFGECINLTSITIPNSVTIISYATFCRCKSLTSITIPDNVTFIDKYAFGDCENLTNVLIENPEIKLYPYAFHECNNLDIQFAGTKAQWINIAEGKFYGVKYTCTCSDGILKN